VAQSRFAWGLLSQQALLGMVPIIQLLFVTRPKVLLSNKAIARLVIVAGERNGELRRITPDRSRGWYSWVESNHRPPVPQ